MQAVFAPARKGDLCLACEVRMVWYQDRPPEERRRWRIYRVHMASRDGRVAAVVAAGDEVPVPIWTLESPVYVASRDEIDVDAALDASAREHPDGFDSLDEAREFLRRFRRQGA